MTISASRTLRALPPPPILLHRKSCSADTALGKPSSGQRTHVMYPTYFIKPLIYTVVGMAALLVFRQANAHLALLGVSQRPAAFPSGPLPAVDFSSVCEGSDRGLSIKHSIEWMNLVGEAASNATFAISQATASAMANATMGVPAAMSNAYYSAVAVFADICSRFTAAAASYASVIIAGRCANGVAYDDSLRELDALDQAKRLAENKINDLYNAVLTAIRSIAERYRHKFSARADDFKSSAAYVEQVERAAYSADRAIKRIHAGHHNKIDESAANQEFDALSAHVYSGEIVERSFEYFRLSNAHTSDALQKIEQMLSAEIVYISNGVGGEFKTPESVMAMMRKFFSNFPDVKWEVKGKPHIEAGKVTLRFEMRLRTEETPVTGTEIIHFDTTGMIAKIEVIRDLIAQDAKEIKELIAIFERGLKERDAALACSAMDNEVLFVNQRGKFFVGRDAVVTRHKEILAKGGPLEKKPAAVYKFLRIDGSSANGNARALISWVYPSDDERGHAVEFSDLDPQQGYFIANFLKKDGKWIIITLQNTATLGLDYTTSRASKEEL